MRTTKITAAFFSPTGNSAMMASVTGFTLAGGLGLPMHMLDLTKPGELHKRHEFGPDDFLVIAMPVYAGRLPSLISPLLRKSIHGNNTPAAAIVTFGNRAYDNALAELRAILDENGFIPNAAAAFCMPHAFVPALGGTRPDAEDERMLHAWVRVMGDNIQTETFDKPDVPGEPDAPYYQPKGIDGAPVNFLKAKPVTNLRTCLHCGACAKVCPLSAIDKTDVSKVPGKCMKCHACIAICPVGAKYFDDPAFFSHVAMLEKTYTEPASSEAIVGMPLHPEVLNQKKF